MCGGVANSRKNSKHYRSQTWTIERLSTWYQTALATFLGFRKPLYSCTEGMCHSSIHPGTSLHMTQFSRPSSTLVLQVSTMLPQKNRGSKEPYTKLCGFLPHVFSPKNLLIICIIIQWNSQLKSWYMPICTHTGGSYIQNTQHQALSIHRHPYTDTLSEIAWLNLNSQSKVNRQQDLCALSNICVCVRGGGTCWK